VTSTWQSSRNEIPLLWLGIAIWTTALLASTQASAQMCKGNISVGCLSPGAVCSPVDSGVGPTGHCTTPPGQPSKDRDCVGASALEKAEAEKLLQMLQRALEAACATG
jgi:hypothetical protein